MTFDVGADAYDRFMGRYSRPLAERFVELLSPRPGQRALDVGAGSGAVTEPLASVLGRPAVAAIDPAARFVAELRERLPGIDARVGAAESLPFDDGAFDIVVAQLVVHFMTDPVAALREMARVCAPGGTVAASVWDFGGGRAPVSLCWRIARELDPSAPDEVEAVGGAAGELTRVLEQAGLDEVREIELTVDVPYADFDAWWEPYTFGVGPLGSWIAGLGPGPRAELRGALEAVLPPTGSVAATAWVGFGRPA